jgi:phage anti-repressor protein
MNEIELINTKKLEQPVAKISNAELEKLIDREFPENSNLIKQKLTEIQSETENGKNRIASAILKLAKSDLNVIDSLVKKANEDFRDIISLAEYPRASKYGFDEPNENKLKTDYLNDWTEYLNWKNILLVISTLFISCQNGINCTINQSNLNSKVYNEQEAICFISKNLNDKKIELNQIENALYIENEYMRKIGIISENEINEEENNLKIELDISKVIEIALKNKKTNITREKLLEIFEAENKYLEFIGIAN